MKTNKILGLFFFSSIIFIPLRSQMPYQELRDQLYEQILDDDLTDEMVGYAREKNLINSPLDESGILPLVGAINAIAPKQVEKLIQYGADVNKTDKHGFSPLMYAVKNQSVPLIEMLLKHHANVNIDDIKGNTPLMLALKNDNLEIARLLAMDPKIDVTKRNTENLFRAEDIALEALKNEANSSKREALKDIINILRNKAASL
ncbi:ankyrin repeat domain-containing protein [Candidatus Dependentiae bacterium]|nr:ankyrin repeat domain-containing protein [Candidatus Dependentiae bacterium]